MVSTEWLDERSMISSRRWRRGWLRRPFAGGGCLVWRGPRMLSTWNEHHLRAEYMPVPIILLMFRKMMVAGPTWYPSGESFSTGAPVTSWYAGRESLLAFSRVYLRLPSDNSSWPGGTAAAVHSFEPSSFPLLKGRRQLKDIVTRSPRLRVTGADKGLMEKAKILRS